MTAEDIVKSLADELYKASSALADTTESALIYQLEKVDEGGDR